MYTEVLIWRTAWKGITVRFSGLEAGSGGLFWYVEAGTTFGTARRPIVPYECLVIRICPSSTFSILCIPQTYSGPI